MRIHHRPDIGFDERALYILWRVVRIVNGAVLSSKSQSDRQLEEACSEARRIIHALHKCQDKFDEVEVSTDTRLCLHSNDVLNKFVYTHDKRLKRKLLGILCVLPYSGKFSYGANFSIFRMLAGRTKLKNYENLNIG